MQNAFVDPLCIPELSPSDATNETTSKNKATLDDGNARHGCASSSLWISSRYSKTHKVTSFLNRIFYNYLFFFSSIESQSKVEVMELSDLHHPNCKINRKLNSDLGVGVGSESCRRESESSDSILLSPEASKATEAVEFIAEHLRNEDLYIQVNT